MRLSICIPTYNRARFLPDLFDSILTQTGYKIEVEVVVSDNASTDNTAAVVTAYSDRLPNLVYSRAEENIGADRNFLRVVDCASGDYCWLMGSDDKLEPGSIAEFERQHARHPDITGMTLNRRAYKFDLATQMYEPRIILANPVEDRHLRSAEEGFSVLGYYLGYISAQIFQRNAWTTAVATSPVAEYCNGYVHIYVIGRTMQARPGWLYVGRPCVGWRSANDSFLTRGGEFERMALDVRGYESIVRGLFGTSSHVYHKLNIAVVSGLVVNAIRTAKLEGADRRFFTKTPPLLLRTYWRYPSFWLRAVPLMLTPAWAVKLVRAGYRRTFKQQRMRRLNSDAS
ncbi:glycosyltransferase family 2 protein [Sphingomonas hankookensis]